MSMMSSTPLMRRVAPVILGALVVSLAAAFYPRSHATALGVVVGGLAALLALVLVRRFSPRDSGTFARSLRGEADERDTRIIMEAGTWTATAAFVLLALDMVAVAWGVGALHVLTATIWLLLAVQYASHAWLQRHR